MKKVTIITTVFNNAEFIRSAIESVLAQSYPNIEYIVKDAGSTDGTLEVVEEYARAGKLKLISQKDSGMYDGLNQAIGASTGDIIALLNADDFYATSDAVAHMAQKMEETGADFGWADIQFVDRKDSKKIVRRWRAGNFARHKLYCGWHPPHPTLFARKAVYEKYGVFRTDLRVAADYEFMLRILTKPELKTCYLPETIITMRAGGASGSLLGRLWRIRLEDARAWKVNGLKGGWLAAWLKPLSKIAQLWT